MALKGLRDFVKFDAKGFLADKQLLLMQESEWKDFDSGKVIGAKLKVTIWTDDTRYKNDGTSNEKARNEWKQGNTDVVSALLTKPSDEGRLPLSEALMGITGTKTSSQLSILQNQFADIQSQLESIMYSVTKMVD